jgi:hypothetical protein
VSTNFKPYGVSYYQATRTSIVFDRCFRRIAKFPGRWPRVDFNGVACTIDEPRCYSGERTFFYQGDEAPRWSSRAAQTALPSASIPGT